MIRASPVVHLLRQAYRIVEAETNNVEGLQMRRKEYLMKVLSVVLIVLIPLIGIPLPAFSTPSDTDTSKTAKILQRNGSYLTIDKGQVHGVKIGMKGMFRFPQKDLEGNDFYVSRGIFEVKKVNESVSEVLVKSLPDDADIKDAVEVFFQERLVRLSTSSSPSRSNPQPGNNLNVEKKTQKEVKPPPQASDKDSNKDESKSVLEEYISKGDDAYYNERDFKKALFNYEEALKLDKENSDLKVKIAQCKEELSLNGEGIIAGKEEMKGLPKSNSEIDIDDSISTEHFIGFQTVEYYGEGKQYRTAFCSMADLERKISKKDRVANYKLLLKGRLLQPDIGNKGFQFEPIEFNRNLDNDYIFFNQEGYYLIEQSLNQTINQVGIGKIKEGHWKKTISLSLEKDYFPNKLTFYIKVQKIDFGVQQTFLLIKIRTYPFAFKTIKENSGPSDNVAAHFEIAMVYSPDDQRLFQSTSVFSACLNNELLRVEEFGFLSDKEGKPIIPFLDFRNEIKLKKVALQVKNFSLFPLWAAQSLKVQQAVNFSCLTTGERGTNWGAILNGIDFALTADSICDLLKLGIEGLTPDYKIKCITSELSKLADKSLGGKYKGAFAKYNVKILVSGLGFILSVPAILTPIGFVGATLSLAGMITAYEEFRNYKEEPDLISSDCYWQIEGFPDDPSVNHLTPPKDANWIKEILNPGEAPDFVDLRGVDIDIPIKTFRPATGIITTALIVSGAGIGGGLLLSKLLSDPTGSSIDVEVENQSSYVFNIKVRTTGDWVTYALNPGDSESFKVPKSGECTTVYYWYQIAGHSYNGSINIKSSCGFSAYDDPVQPGHVSVAGSLSDC